MQHAKRRIYGYLMVQTCLFIFTFYLFLIFTPKKYVHFVFDDDSDARFFKRLISSIAIILGSSWACSHIANAMLTLANSPDLDSANVMIDRYSQKLKDLSEEATEIGDMPILDMTRKRLVKYNQSKQFFLKKATT